MGLYSTRQASARETYSSFLPHLSFTANLLSSYYLPGAVVDPRGEGWVGTHHQVMETDKDTALTGEGQMEKTAELWVRAKE